MSLRVVAAAALCGLVAGISACKESEQDQTQAGPSPSEESPISELRVGMRALREDNIQIQEALATLIAKQEGPRTKEEALAKYEVEKKTFDEVVKSSPALGTLPPELLTRLKRCVSAAQQLELAEGTVKSEFSMPGCSTDEARALVNDLESVKESARTAWQGCKEVLASKDPAISLPNDVAPLAGAALERAKRSDPVCAEKMEKEEKKFSEAKQAQSQLSSAIRIGAAVCYANGGWGYPAVCIALDVLAALVDLFSKKGGGGGGSSDGVSTQSNGGGKSDQKYDGTEGGNLGSPIKGSVACLAANDVLTCWIAGKKDSTARKFTVTDEEPSMAPAAEALRTLIREKNNAHLVTCRSGDAVAAVFVRDPARSDAWYAIAYDEVLGRSVLPTATHQSASCNIAI